MFPCAFSVPTCRSCTLPTPVTYPHCLPLAYCFPAPPVSATTHHLLHTCFLPFLHLQCSTSFFCTLPGFLSSCWMHFTTCLHYIPLLHSCACTAPCCCLRTALLPCFGLHRRTALPPVFLFCHTLVCCPLSTPFRLPMPGFVRQFNAHFWFLLLPPAHRRWVATLRFFTAAGWIFSAATASPLYGSGFSTFLRSACYDYFRCAAHPLWLCALRTFAHAFHALFTFCITCRA